jgi:predicted DNA-binding transcriptional regulator YafY
VKITYVSGKGERTERIVEPLGLSFESFRWHLFAFCRLRQDTRFFRLDRMVDVEILDDEIPDRDLPPFQERMVDLIRSRPMNDVILKFSGRSDHDRIKRRCFYGITGERSADNGWEMSLKMENLDVLAEWLLPLGSRVSILHPPELVDTMASLSRELYEHYCNEKKDERRPGEKEEERA